MQRYSAPDTPGPPAGSDGHPASHVTPRASAPTFCTGASRVGRTLGGKRRRLQVGAKLPSPPLRQASTHQGLAQGQPLSPQPGSHLCLTRGRTGISKLGSKPKGFRQVSERTPTSESPSGGGRGFGDIPSELFRPGPGSCFSSPYPTLLPTPSLERRKGGLTVPFRLSMDSAHRR